MKPNPLMRQLAGKQPLPSTAPPKIAGPATKPHVDRKQPAVRKTIKGR